MIYRLNIVGKKFVQDKYIFIHLIYIYPSAHTFSYDHTNKVDCRRWEKHHKNLVIRQIGRSGKIDCATRVKNVLHSILIPKEVFIIIGFGGFIQKKSMQNLFF